MATHTKAGVGYNIQIAVATRPAWPERREEARLRSRTG
jgi:hypothetical protein